MCVFVTYNNQTTLSMLVVVYLQLVGNIDTWELVNSVVGSLRVEISVVVGTSVVEVFTVDICTVVVCTSILNRYVVSYFYFCYYCTNSIFNVAP